ncbi:MAG: hypothetical protein ACLTMP_01190 [Eggerthella lenta]
MTSNELLDAVSARKAVSIGKLRGEALRAALSEMRDPELMAFLSNVDVSRVAKIVAVSSIDDIDLLLAIAAGTVPASSGETRCTASTSYAIARPSTFATRSASSPV